METAKKEDITDYITHNMQNSKYSVLRPTLRYTVEINYGSHKNVF